MDKLAKTLLIMFLVAISIIILSLFSEPVPTTGGAGLLINSTGASTYSDPGSSLEDLLASVVQLNSTLADFMITTQVSLYDSIPEGGRCCLGFFYLLGGLLCVFGVVTLSAGVGIWRRFI